MRIIILFQTPGQTRCLLEQNDNNNQFVSFYVEY